jgi:hypothetical protein
VEYLRPVFGLISAALREGVMRGEFRPVDPRQFTVSMVGIIVHYFASAPIAEAITGEDPFTPKRLAQRREAVLDVIAAALFSKPTHPQAQFEIRANAGTSTERMGGWEGLDQALSRVEKRLITKHTKEHKGRRTSESAK